MRAEDPGGGHDSGAETRGAGDELVRFGVSIERGLLERFDRLCGRLGYRTRSEALRDLIRDQLGQQGWQDEAAWVCGAITIVYRHDRHAAARALVELGHGAVDCVVSTLHVHLDADWCMEALVLRGPAARVRALVERVDALKGLIHGRFSLVALDELPGPPGQADTPGPREA